MKVLNELSKLLTNKHFLYFTVFLAFTNILGYLVVHKINAVIIFGLISVITYQFSKNMTVILLVSIFATNFLMANKKVREGLDNPTNNKDNNKDKVNMSSSLNTIEDKDPQIADAIPYLQKANANSDISKKVQTNNTRRNETIDKITDTNNADLNATNDDEDEIQGIGSQMGGKKGGKNDLKPRIDYATTIEESYANLDKLLGSKSIKQLSNDTKNLMSQQQTLFDTMQNMVPVLEDAQKMLKDFNIDGLTNSLKKIGPQ